MKIAILGAGWLGEPLAKQLQKSPYRVWASTTSLEKAQRLNSIGLDVRILEATEEGLKGDTQGFFTADLLVLSLPPGGRRNPAVEETYPAKITHIITAARKGGIEKVLFTSSTGIYGDQEGNITEQSPLLPTTHSGKALLQVEQLLQAAFGDKLTILRLSGLCGPDRQPGRWFAGKENVAQGNHYINLVHQQDVLAVMNRVMDQNAWGHTINVCCDEHPTKAEFYPLAARQIRQEPPTFIPTTVAPKGKRIDNSLGKQLLDFEYHYTHPRQFNE